MGFSKTFCSLHLHELESSVGGRHEVFEATAVGVSVLDPVDDQLGDVGRVATAASKGDSSAGYRTI
jgi:hypothetical protein